MNEPEQKNQPDKKIDLLEYWRVLVRHKWVIVKIAGGTFVISIITFLIE